MYHGFLKIITLEERQGPQIHESGPEKPALSENSGLVGFFKGLFTRDEPTCQKGEVTTRPYVYGSCDLRLAH